MPRKKSYVHNKWNMCTDKNNTEESLGTKSGMGELNSSSDYTDKMGDEEYLQIENGTKTKSLEVGKISIVSSFNRLTSCVIFPYVISGYCDIVYK